MALNKHQRSYTQLANYSAKKHARESEKRDAATVYGQRVQVHSDVYSSADRVHHLWILISASNFCFARSFVSEDFNTTLPAITRFLDSDVNW